MREGETKKEEEMWEKRCGIKARKGDEGKEERRRIKERGRRRRSSRW